MNATDLITQIKIASPCHARWEEMTGDERARFCSQCQKHVYNFSVMTPEAIAELVQAKEGKLCGRFYRRADGTMLTADCPVGLRWASRRLKVLVLAAGGLLLASLYLRALGNAPDAAREKGPFAQKC